MHREPLNQEIVNAFSLMIVPIVVAIVLFLIAHPFSGSSSSSTCVTSLLACLFCP